MRRTSTMRRRWALPAPSYQLRCCLLLCLLLHLLLPVFSLHLSLPAQSYDAAELPAVVSLSSLSINYSHHHARHQLDESLLFSLFSAPSSASISHHPLSLSLPHSQSNADAALTIRSLSFASASPPDDAADVHAACASSLSHGLSVSLCPSFPHELTSVDALTLLLQYSPTRVAVPSPYYLLINTTHRVYSSRIHVAVPASFAPYQLLPFSSSASSSSTTALLSLPSVLLSAAAAVPLLALLLLTIAVLLAQSGHLQPAQVAAALTRHRLGLLLPLHRLLTPVLYHPAHALHSTTTAQPPRAPARPTPAAAAAPSSSSLMSPSHVLFQRSAASCSSSPRAEATGTASFSASPSSRHCPSQCVVSSEPLLPESLAPLSLRHSKSLSLGSGEMMMKEAMREKRRRREKDDRGAAGGRAAGKDDGPGRQGGKTAGRRLRADGRSAGGAGSDGDGSALLSMVSPPKTRRTMSVGSSGPIFFRFDRVVAESDDEQQTAASSDDSRTTTDSDASSRSGAVNRDSSPDEERAAAAAAQQHSQQAGKHAEERKAISPRAAHQPATEPAVAAVSIGANSGSAVQSAASTAAPSLAGSVQHRSAHSAAQPSASTPRRVAQAEQPRLSPSSSTLSASAPPYISPRQSSSPANPSARGPYLVSSPRLSAGFYPHHPYPPLPLSSVPAPPRLPSPSARLYPPHARPSRALMQPPALYAAPPPSASAVAASSYLAAQQQKERMIAQEKAQLLAASMHIHPQQSQHRYSSSDIIVYNLSDGFFHPPPSSPVARPSLPHLVLPKSPESTPALAPASPQAARQNVSPSHRFLAPNVGGAVGLARDGRWAAAGALDGGDWPDTHLAAHRRQLAASVGFHSTGGIPPAATMQSSSDVGLFETIQEEVEHATPVWSAEQRPQLPSALQLSPAAPPASSATSVSSSAASSFSPPLSFSFPVPAASSSPSLPLFGAPARSPILSSIPASASSSSAASWSTPGSPSTASLLLLPPLSASSPAPSPLGVDGDAVADAEDLMALQAMDAWDAENDRRRGEGDREADKADKHRQDRQDGQDGPDTEDGATEAETSDDDEPGYRKDSMDNGGLAEALGRARALHSFQLLARSANGSAATLLPAPSSAAAVTADTAVDASKAS